MCNKGAVFGFLQLQKEKDEGALDRARRKDEEKEQNSVEEDAYKLLWIKTLESFNFHRTVYERILLPYQYSRSYDPYSRIAPPRE